MLVPVRKVLQGFDKTYVEKEETCPGGGKMRYRVFVEEPLSEWRDHWRPMHAMIGLEEGSTLHSQKDSLLLDLDAARWLHEMLGEAIKRAVHAEQEAKLAEIEIKQKENEK